MKVQGLRSSLVFGAAISIVLVFNQHVFAPFLGSWNVLALHLAGSTIAYSALIARTPRTAIRNAIVATACAMALLAFVSGQATGIRELAMGLTGTLALVRSGFGVIHRPRSIIIELVIGGTALVFAAWLSTPGWLGYAAGLWGYALVQSLYFLVPRPRDERRSEVEGDAFDRARERLLDMLEDF